MFCALFIKYDEDRFTAKNWRNCIVNRVFVNNSIALVKKISASCVVFEL